MRQKEANASAQRRFLGQLGDLAEPGTLGRHLQWAKQGLSGRLTRAWAQTHLPAWLIGSTHTARNVSPSRHCLEELRLTSTLLRQSRGRHPSQSERALVCACVPPWVSDGGREAEVEVVVALRVARGAAAAAEAATAALRWWRRSSPWLLGLSARLPASPEPAGARAGQRLPYECVTGCYPTGARRTLARSRRLRLLRRGWVPRPRRLPCSPCLDPRGSPSSRGTGSGKGRGERCYLRKKLRSGWFPLIPSFLKRPSLVSSLGRHSRSLPPGTFPRALCLHLARRLPALGYSGVL